MALEPAVQLFSVDAAAYLAGIDEMLAATDRLAASLDAVVKSAQAMSASLSASAARADEGLITVAGAAGETLAATERAAEGQIALADSAKAATGALAAEARAMKAAGDSAVIAGDEAAAAGDKTVLAGREAEAAGGKAAAAGGMWKTAFLGVAIALGYGIDQAAKYQSATTRLVTSANETDKNLGMVRSGLLTMASQVGETATALANGMYVVESAGYHGAAGLTVMRAAAQGARDENADLGTVANAVTDVLVDYHLKAAAAADVTSKLVEAVSFGKTNFQEFSQSMSVILPLASSLRLRFADVVGVEAEMTSHGISAQEAAQQMANTMRHLMNPTKVMIKSLGEFGLGAGDLARHLASQGLGGTLQWLRGVAEQLAPSLGMTVPEALAKMLGSASGLQVALATTGENAKGTNAAIAGIGRASKDAQGNVRGFSEVQKTFGFQLSALKAGAQSLAISFGTVLLPAATKIVGELAKFAGIMEQHPVIAEFAGAMLAVAVAFKVAAAAEAMFNAVTDANPVMLVILAVLALGVGLYELYTHFKVVRDVVADVGKFLQSAWSDAVKAAGAVTAWFASGPLAWVKQQLAMFAQFWAQHGREVEEIASAVWHAISSTVVVAWRLLWDMEVKPGLVLLEAAWRVAWGLVRDTVILAWKTISAVIAAAVHVILDIIGVALDVLTGHWSQAMHDLGKLCYDAIWGIANIISTFARGALTLLYDAGRNIVLGLIHGIESMGSAALNVVGNLASSVYHHALSFLGIHSPSTLFYYLGSMITAGLAGGITETTAKAEAAARALAAKVYAAYSAGQITASQEAELLGRISDRLASLGKSAAAAAAQMEYMRLGAGIAASIGSGITETMPQAQAAARRLMAGIARELAEGRISQRQADELTLKIQESLTSRRDRLVKTMQKIGLEMQAGMLSSLENATSAATAKTAVDKLIGYVRQAWSAGDITRSQASSMTAWLERDNTRLQGLAAERQKLTATIKAAVAYANTTTSNTEQWAGIANVASSTTSGGMVYSGNILAGMRANLASINQFTAAIRRLGRMGLRKDLLNQLIQMGPAQGLQVAEALLNGPAKVIAEINATQAGIASGSSALGQAAANAMYDTGSAAGKGFLSGLQAQESQVTRMMDRVAKSMAETLRKELGMDGRGGGGGSRPNITVHVSGFIGSERQLVDELYKAIQQESLRHAKRNGNNGLSLSF